MTMAMLAVPVGRRRTTRLDVGVPAPVLHVDVTAGPTEITWQLDAGSTFGPHDRLVVVAKNDPLDPPPKDYPPVSWPFLRGGADHELRGDEGIDLLASGPLRPDLDRSVWAYEIQIRDRHDEVVATSDPWIVVEKP